MPANRTLDITASEHPELSGYEWTDEPIRPFGGGSGPTSGAATCALAPEHESVRIARSFATTTLRDWGSAELRDEVELVVSELVTNALQAVEQTEQSIHLKLVRKGHYVVCLVMDSRDEPPARTELDCSPELAADPGWWLHLVHGCCRRWGWTHLRGGGKVVWALFCIPY